MPSAQPPLIAIVLPPSEAFTPVGTGAIGTQARNFALASAAFHTVVIGRPQNGPTFDGIRFEPVQRLCLPVSAAWRYAAGAARRIAALRPAMIEVHNRPEIARRLARRFPEAKVALFLHNDPQGMRGFRGADARQRLLRALAAIYPVSGFIRARLLHGIADPAANVLDHRNCLDLAALPPPRASERLILFAGRVVADKGADLFVEACARALPALPGWRAELIGADRFADGGRDTRFIHDLRPRAAAAGVALAGYRPPEAVRHAMAGAAIVVVPSRWDEPFGMVALEAMAAGSALICSRRGGLPEMAGSAARYLDRPDPDLLAGLITALARDPEERSRLGALGRERAAHFGLAPVGADLDRHRRRLLGV